MSKKQPSIKDVARHARTSITTVSRIVTKAPYPVSLQLRQRVIHSIKELGYRPNYMAQNLRGNQSQTIGLLVRDIADPYCAALAAGVTEEATALGLMPFVCSSRRNPSFELELLHRFAQYRVAGIILAGAGWIDYFTQPRWQKAIDDIRAQGVVIVLCAPQPVPMPSVTIDNKMLGKEAFTLLYSYGHRTFGLISGVSANRANQLRFDGFIESALASGVSVNPDKHMMTGSFSWEFGYTAAHTLLQRVPDITAFFCASEIMAQGALRYLEENNIPVPLDISLLAVSGSLCASARPGISSYHIPYYDLGLAAVRLVVDPQLYETNTVILPFSYVNRHSVAIARSLR